MGGRRSRGSRKNEQDPTNDDGGLVNYQSFPENDVAFQPQSMDHRGFSSSINDIFTNPEHERVDCCAMACCGVLQNDRDRYLITGITPPSCCRRVWIHIVLPIWFFAMAMLCAVKIPDVFLNQVLSTGFVVVLVGYFVIQCMKGMWKRREVRKELLWSKFHARASGTFRPRSDDDTLEDGTSYLMGQTRADLRNAHSLCGCYASDYPDSHEGRPRGNLCSNIFQCYTQTFCGALCGLHLQFCGIFAVAQEARELENLTEPGYRYIDYITMQPMMEYYTAIYKFRHQAGNTGESTFSLEFWNRLSTFSKSTLGSAISVVIFLLVWSLLGYHRDFHLENFFVFMATLLQAYVVLKAVHWNHTKDISTDALVKFFAAGFCLSTSLAIFYELLVGLTVRLIMTLLMAVSGIDVVEAEGYNLFGMGFAKGPSYSDLLTMQEAEDPTGYRDYLQAYGKDHVFIYTLYLIVSAFLLAALIEELCKYFGFRMIEHPDFFSRGMVEDALKAEQETNQKDAQRIDVSQQEKSLQSRAAAITVAMVATALGFACCENLVYIFIYGDSTVGVQVFILIARSLFPVHPIAAALQSIKVCERDLEKKGNIGLGQIAFTGVLFHGLYDFLLMWIEFLASRNANYVEDDDEDTFDEDFQTMWISFVSSIAVIIVALCYFFTESKKQRKRLHTMDRQSSVDNSRLL